MSEQVKRYDAVHIRYEDNNIRYGEGCEVEVVTARDYDALEAEFERLRAQVSALQSDANSWQSGYDKGREDGAKAAEGWKAQHARDSAELRRLCAEREALAAELEAIKGRRWMVGTNSHIAKLKALAKLESDQAVLQCAVNIVQRVTDALDIHPGVPVLAALGRVVEPPKCHYQPMDLVAVDGAWNWQCGHCHKTEAVPERVPE